MLRFLTLFMIFCVVISNNMARADAFVCVDSNGKKSFSNEACSKKGLKSANNEFPVVAGQAISATVIMPKKDSGPKVVQGGGMMSSDGKFVTKPGQIYMDSELPLEKPVLYFLLIMLTGTAALFCLIFIRFFKAHHAKLKRD